MYKAFKNILLLKKEAFLFPILLMILSFPGTPVFSQLIYPDQPVKVKYLSFNRDTPEEITKREYHYVYNQNKDVISLEEYRTELEFPLWQKEEYRYLDDQLTYSSIKYYRNNPVFENKDETDYFYYDTCLVEKVFNNDNDFLPERIITTYDSLTCNISSKITYKLFSNSPDYIPTQKIEWTYEDKKEEKFTYSYFSNDEEFQLMFAEATHYDEDNQVLKIIRESVLNSQIDSTIYHYELDQPYPSLTETYQSFDQGVSWFLYNFHTIEVQGDSVFLNTKVYNANGFLTSEDTNIYISQKNEKDLLEKNSHFRTIFYATSGVTDHYSALTFYKYDCQDRLIERANEYEGSYGRVYFFEYDDDLCDDLEIEVEESISITPNPSSDYIYVEGDLVGEPKTKISIVTLAGKSIPVTNEQLGLNRMRISIDFLPVGVYIVNAQLGDKQAAELFIRN